MAAHKKDRDATEEKRAAMLAVLKRYKVTDKTGTSHLKGTRRSEAKAALNWLNINPAPKKGKTKKK